MAQRRRSRSATVPRLLRQIADFNRRGLDELALPEYNARRSPRNSRLVGPVLRSEGRPIQLPPGRYTRSSNNKNSNRRPGQRRRQRPLPEEVDDDDQPMAAQYNDDEPQYAVHPPFSTDPDYDYNGFGNTLVGNYGQFPFHNYRWGEPNPGVVGLNSSFNNEFSTDQMFTRNHLISLLSYQYADSRAYGRITPMENRIPSNPLTRFNFARVGVDFGQISQEVVNYEIGPFTYEEHINIQAGAFAFLAIEVLARRLSRRESLLGASINLHIMIWGNALLILNDHGRTFYQEDDVDPAQGTTTVSQQANDTLRAMRIEVTSNFDIPNTRDEVQRSIRTWYWALFGNLVQEISTAYNELNMQLNVNDLESGNSEIYNLMRNQGVTPSGFDWISSGTELTYHIDIVRAAGCGPLSQNEIFGREKKGVIRIPETEHNICLPMAVYASKLLAAQSKFQFNNQIVAWINGTLNLLKANNYPIGQFWDPQMLNEFAYQCGMKLLVFDGDRLNQNVVLYKSEDNIANASLPYAIIYIRKKHAWVISSVTAYLKCRNYCIYCCKPYYEVHRCSKVTCPACCSNHVHDPQIDEMKICDKCNGIFYLDCYNHHTLSGACGYIYYCYQPHCWSKGKPIFRTKTAMQHHDCFSEKHKCRVCGVLYDHSNDLERFQHRCFLQKKKLKEPSEKYVAFDFETHNDKVVLAISCYVYDFSIPLQYHYDIESFINFLLQDKHDGYKFFAHNGKGFDFHFILSAVITRPNTTPYVVFNGTKIVSLEIRFPVAVIHGNSKKRMNSVHFIDTLAFFLQPLASLPKTFNFEEKTKGFFAHWLPEEKWSDNTLPAIEYYRPEIMSKARHTEFMDWYQKEFALNNFYDHKTMLVNYCESDVDILTTAIRIFRKTCMEEEKIDPFTNCKTIASLSLTIYLANYMRPNSIGLMTDAEETFIRKAFMGGRTGCYYFSYNFKPGEFGSYYDVVSLYPWINSNCEYPIGHGKFINSYSGPNLNRVPFDMKGVIEVTVSSPDDIIHPILPHVCPNTKSLLFSRHKKLQGKWTHAELQLAVEFGYKILEFHTALVWDTWEASPFASYMNTAVSKKQQYKGYPENCKTEEEKKEYIESFRRQGVHLKNVVKNPGAAYLNKILANSFWGKLCQRRHHTESTYCNTVDLYKKLYNSKTHVRQLHLFGEEFEKAYILSDYNDPRDDPRRNNKIVPIVGVFTCSYGRIRISRALQALGRRALYWDTDSIIFVNDANYTPPFEIGEALGCFKNELSNGEHITHWVCIAPKFYLYETNKKKMTKKCKGIRVTNDVDTQITKDSLSNVISNDVVVVKQSNLICKSKHGVPTEFNNEKIIKFVNNKGITRLDNEGNLYNDCFSF